VQAMAWCIMRGRKRGRRIMTIWLRILCGRLRSGLRCFGVSVGWWG